MIPTLDRVLVRRVKAQSKSTGGVLLPESAQKRLNEAVVVSVGPGRQREDGSFVQPAVKVGDTVLLPEYGGNMVSLEEDEDYLIYRDDDLLGVYQE